MATRQDIQPDRSYSTGEVAHFMGYTDGYVRRLIRDNRIASSKPSGPTGQHRVTGAEIIRVMATMETSGHLPSTGSRDEPADVIVVDDEAAEKVFGTDPPAPPPADISPPDQDFSDLSLYEQMQRRFPENN